MRGVLLTAAAVAVLLVAHAPVASAAESPSHWCGPGESATDLPDTSTNADLVHVVYAYPSDGTDRFATLSLGIARDVAAIDSWWRAQDSQRAPRWDLAAFPGCDTAFGSLDVTVAKLPQPTGWYASLDTVVSRLEADLNAPPTSLGDPDKKYLVLYDGQLNQGSGSAVCGLSPTRVLGGGPTAYAVVFLMHPCGDGLGAATNTAGTIAHELIHNLGALAPTGPPHACPTSPAHPCDSDADVLSPSGEYGRVLSELQLDVGRDDYYGHSGSWWDVQDSPFLEHVGQTFALPTATTGLTATNHGGSVDLAWQPATSANGTVAYRVTRDGVLLGKATRAAWNDNVDPLSTHTWAVRPEDALGFLGPVQELRFTLAATPAAAASGTTARDVTPPTRPTGLRATRTAAGGIVLSWHPSSDSSGVKGYRVARNGVRYRGLVRGTSLSVPKAYAKGNWTVTALDAAGNASRPSAARRVA